MTPICVVRLTNFIVFVFYLFLPTPTSAIWIPYAVIKSVSKFYSFSFLYNTFKLRNYYSFVLRSEKAYTPTIVLKHSNGTM